MTSSPCCHATCYIENDTDNRSHWYVCAECGQPCDPQPERDGDALDNSCANTVARGEVTK